MSKEDPYLVVCCHMCGSRQSTVEAGHKDGSILYRDLECKYCGTIYTTSEELKEEY